VRDPVHFTGGGDDLHGAVGAGRHLRAQRGIAGLEHDRLVGGEGLHLGEVDGDVAGALGLDRQLAALRLDDLARQAVAVQEQDLVGGGRAGEQQRQGESPRERQK
jgi:hypothetical protein